MKIYKSEYFIDSWASETTNLGFYILDKIEIDSFISNGITVENLMEKLENLDWGKYEPKDQELDFLFDDISTSEFEQYLKNRYKALNAEQQTVLWFY